MPHFAPCSPPDLSFNIRGILFKTLNSSRLVGEDICNATRGKRNKGMASAGLDAPPFQFRLLAIL